MGESIEGLRTPSALYTWAMLEPDGELPPRRAGTYGWYFRRAAIPASLPMLGVYELPADPAWVLLYVGIAPARRSAESAPSRETLRRRLRTHFGGTARRSTLRLSLGCLLREQLGIAAARAGRGPRVDFGVGEAKLSRWMAQHARVCWVESARPWDLEHEALATLCLPLNLAGNQRGEASRLLTRLRREAREQAGRGRGDGGVTQTG